jgi:hypothetical protein
VPHARAEEWFVSAALDEQSGVTRGKGKKFPAGKRKREEGGIERKRERKETETSKATLSSPALLAVPLYSVVSARMTFPGGK